MTIGGTIGNNIKRIRTQKGMTQKQLGDLLGISVQTVSAYESGRRRPKMETIERFAGALGVQFSALFGLDDPKTPDYQAALDLSLKESMNRHGELDENAFFENLRYNNATVRYHDLEILRKKTDHLYIEQLKTIPDEELKAIAILSFDSLNRVGKIEAILRPYELETLPHYSTWSLEITKKKENPDNIISNYKEQVPETDPDTPEPD